MILKPEEKEAKKNKIMEACLEYYCQNGLNETGMSALGKACGINQSSFYTYFKNLDDLIVQSTAYGMMKVEDEFMEKAPTKREDVLAFFQEIPYWTAKRHGAKYRFMYQVYSSPKYLKDGQNFFEGVNQRYAEYAGRIEVRLGIPKEVILSFIFTLIRASVHYAMFEDEYYLKLQIELLKNAYSGIIEKYSPEV